MPPEQVFVPTWLAALLLGVGVASLAVWWRIGLRCLRGQPVLRRRPARRAPWNAVAALPAGFFVLASAMSLLGSLVEPEEPEPLVIDFGIALSFFTTWLVILAVTLAIIVATDTQRRLRLRDFGIPRRASEAIGGVGLGVTGFAAALAPTYLVQMILVLVVDLPASHPTVEQILADPSGETLLVSVFLAVLMAPLFEEFAFRVLLQGWLERVAGREAWWPIVVSSLAFAAAHSGQGWAPIPLFVWALIVGYLYRQTHSYPAVVALHMAFNSLSLTFALGMSQAAGPG